VKEQLSRRRSKKPTGVSVKKNQNRHVINLLVLGIEL